MGTPIESGDPAQGGNTPGPNPAWSDVLGVIPQELHDQVTPFFQQWDQAAQQRVEAANAQVETFKAYAPFAEHGIAADELERGLQLMYQINTNPKEVWEALGEAYNLTPQQVANLQQQSADPNSAVPSAEDLANDPRYQQLRDGLEVVSQIVLQEQQAKKQAADDAALEKEMSDLRTKHGEFDEDYVLSMMDRGKTGPEAIAAYQALISRVGGAGQQPYAPNILGSSGGTGSGLPSRAIDPTKLSGKDTRSLVQQMLDAAKLD